MGSGQNGTYFKLDGEDCFIASSSGQHLALPKNIALTKQTKNTKPR